MAEAYAYDPIAEQWLGKVPVEWFDVFPHLEHTDKDGKRPQTADRVPLGTLSVKQLRAYATSRQIELDGAKRKDELVEAIANAERVPGDPIEPADPTQHEVDPGPAGSADGDDDGDTDV